MSKLLALCPRSSYFCTTMISSSQVAMARCKVMIPSHQTSLLTRSPGHSIHTSQTCCLRKAPQTRKKFFGIDWVYIPWPSMLIKALFRRKYKKEDLGLSEEYRRSIFHRISLVYMALSWTGMGLMAYMFYFMGPSEEELSEYKEKNGGELPHQGDIDRGGAMYWVSALKTPDEMQDMKEIKIVKFSGLSFKGVEDVTVKAKEIGQEMNRRVYEKSDDYFLRQRLKIPQLEEGGPTNQQLRDQFAEEGRDFELELDYYNQRAKRKTNYNPDGTVGSFVNKEDIEYGNKRPGDELAEEEMAL